MEKVVFVDNESRRALKQEIRKEVILEIVEDSKCRKCKRFKNYAKKHSVRIDHED
ncbi:hypothetical protein [Helicovermis profundi]|uniref:Uncharacterized protein n=1 Tax=Helicovermis profundi TaxID=3065157 RepID=A0AAU9E4A3_9FIRM|nr:hypothetical protein HLPR_11310 [Clostridia bacterium S502]